MPAFVEGSRGQYLIGEILNACGRTAEAREHWTRAVKGNDWANIKPVYAHLASKRLGPIDEAASKRSLQESLARAEATLERGTGFPAIATYSQGLLLRALGREPEARGLPARSSCSPTIGSRIFWPGCPGGTLLTRTANQASGRREVSLAAYRISVVRPVALQHTHEHI
jgi:hypothetical protein